MNEQRVIPDLFDFAWAAGLFEGEGCFTTTHQRKADGTFRSTRRVFARLSSTDRDVLERFQRIIGFGAIYTQRRSQRKPHWKIAYQWGASDAAQVREVIDLFRPFLCKRRLARANEIYAISLDLKVHSGHATHCPTGHEYTTHNTIFERRKGKMVRRCRICRRGDARRWEARRKAAA